MCFPFAVWGLAGVTVRGPGAEAEEGERLLSWAGSAAVSRGAQEVF